MENTCIGKKCFFWNKKKICPFYVEVWHENDKGEKKLTEDCSPKRMVFMMGDLYVRIMGAQKASEQARNITFDFVGGLQKMLEERQKLLEISDGRI